MDLSEMFIWVSIALASVVSLLTLYNAARLKTGVLAVSTYAFGGGMLSLTAAFSLIALPMLWTDPDMAGTVSRILFLTGFLLLGWGSFKIYRMSQV